MPDQETNTAADRLFRIVSGVYGRQDTTMLNIWAEVLPVPSKNRLEVFKGVLSVADLVDEVESTVRQHGGSGAKLYLRALDQVRHILMSNVDAHRSHLNHLLKPELITDLEHCVAKYSEIDHEIPVSSEEIESIKKRVEELFADVSKSNHLPKEFRQQLLDLLEVIRQQVAQFQIRGVTALHECLRQSMARLLELYPLVQQKRDEPLLKRIVSVVTDISTICEKAQKALPLLKYAGKVLPLLGFTNGHTALPEIVDAEILTDEPK